MKKYFLRIVISSLCLMNSFLPVSAHNENGDEKKSARFYPVGELGAQWTLGSDHLPVGGTIGSVHFAMWNILNTSALHHILGNGQGLRDSFIMTANIPLQGNLTLRESVIINQIFEMLQHPTHPRSLLALQETSENVYLKLQESLPPNLQLLPPDVNDLRNGDIFIFDSGIFDFVDFKCTQYKNEQSKHGKTYMTLTLLEKGTQILYKFVQSHVPGGPEVNSLPARIELANAVMSDYNSEAVSVVVGDMNRSPDYFIKHFESAAVEHDFESQPFEIMWPPYATHINTHMEASWIDNILIAIPSAYKLTLHAEVTDKASDFFTGLQETLDLLESMRPSP